MSAKTDLLKTLLQKIYKHEEVLARFNQDNVDEETVPSSSVSHALQVRRKTFFEWLFILW